MYISIKRGKKKDLLSQSPAPIPALVVAAAYRLANVGLLRLGVSKFQIKDMEMEATLPQKRFSKVLY